MDVHIAKLMKVSIRLRPSCFFYYVNVMIVVSDRSLSVVKISFSSLRDMSLLAIKV